MYSYASAFMCYIEYICIVCMGFCNSLISLDFFSEESHNVFSSANNFNDTMFHFNSICTWYAFLSTLHNAKWRYRMVPNNQVLFPVWTKFLNDVWLFKMLERFAWLVVLSKNELCEYMKWQYEKIKLFIHKFKMIKVWEYKSILLHTFNEVYTSSVSVLSSCYEGFYTVVHVFWYPWK